MLIDKYINGSLTESESIEVQSRIKNDASFARDVKLRMEIYNTIADDKKMALLMNLQNIKTKKTRHTIKINIYSRQVQAFAASIVVFLIVGAALLSNYVVNNKVSTYDIYNSSLVDEGSLITTRSVTISSNSSVEKGIKLYNNERYSEAINLFDSNPENIVARLYTGLSYMKLEQFNLAEKQFKYIINHSDNIFIDQAEWNLGLSYLANNKTKQAQVIFAKIATENGAYSTPASDIIKKLENK